MRVRLTRKLSDTLDGVDLSRAQVGDELDLTRVEAELVIAEGWAEPVADRRLTLVRRGPERRKLASFVLPKAEAADAPRRSGRTAKRDAHSDLVGNDPSGERPQRRAEDRIREEHHDSRAKILPNKQELWSDLVRRS
jgi:hypothetical protein